MSFVWKELVLSEPGDCYVVNKRPYLKDHMEELESSTHAIVS
jgi:hypothetical protein